MIALLNPKTIIACVLFLALAYGAYLFKRVDILKSKLATVEQINKDNLQAIDHIKNEYLKTQKALENDLNQVRIRNEETIAILERMKNEKDAPVAPVLLSVINSLRNRKQSAN